MPVDPAQPPRLSGAGRDAERIASLERRLRALETQLQGGATSAIPVVAALPAAGREGRLLKLASGGVYVDTGSGWTAL